MKDRDATRARFLTDPLPKRLGALAADLARVSSSAHKSRFESAELMMEESLWFIEWVAGDLEPNVAAELVDMQLMLGIWRKLLPDVQQNSRLRVLLYLQTKKWSEQVLDYSGLLTQE